MSGLPFDELDFLEFFGALPEIDQEWNRFTYLTTKNGLILDFTICAWRRSVTLSLGRFDSPKPLVSFTVLVRGMVRRRQEKWGEYLEFTDCVLSDESAYLPPAGDAPSPTDIMTLVVFVEPDFRIQFE